MRIRNAGLFLRVGTRADFASSLVVVDVAEVLGAGDFSVPGEAAALAGVAFVGSGVRLGMHADVAHLLREGARVQLGNEATLLLLPNAHVPDGANVDDSVVGAAHVVEQAADRRRVLVAFSLGCVHGHRREHLGLLVLAGLRGVVVLLAHRTAVVWTYVLAHQVVLIAWGDYLLLVLLGAAFAVGNLLSWQVDLLTLVAHRRLQDDLLLWIFQARRIVAMVVYHVNIFYGLDSVIGVVEVLGRLIEHVDVVVILKLFGLLVDLVSELEVFVEASPGGASSRISRSLALSFDALDDFASLGIDATKWIHTAVLLMRMQNIVAHTRLHNSLLRLILWVVTHIVAHHLARGSVLHVLGGVHVGCNVWRIRSSSHDDLLLVASDIGRMLRPLAALLPDLVQFLLHVLLSHLVALQVELLLVRRLLPRIVLRSLNLVFHVLRQDLRGNVDRRPKGGLWIDSC